MTWAVTRTSETIYHTEAAARVAASFSGPKVTVRALWAIHLGQKHFVGWTTVLIEETAVNGKHF